MPSTATSILDDLADALVSSGKFELVTVGKPGSSTAVPRANVACEGLEQFRPDDSPSHRWVRLRARVAIRSRSNNPTEAMSRLLDLSDQAEEAILSDRFRTNLAQDLPIGLATEIVRGEISYTIKRPEAEASFAVNCHFQVQEGQ